MSKETTPKVRFISELEDRSIPTLTPRAEVDGDGDFHLMVTDCEGDRWSIAFIDANTGKLVLHSGIPEETGLSVTPDGTIRTRKL